jgi:hypothetical protein
MSRRIHRLLVLTVLTVPVTVGASVPASAGFAAPVSVPTTTIATGTVAAPASVTVTVDQYYLTYQPRLSVLTLTDHGWTAESPQSAVLTC